MRARLRWAVATFFLVWVPWSIVLGTNWGRELRFGGDDAAHLGPILEGIINFAAVTLVPAMLIGLFVFAIHAAVTEKSER